MSIILVNASTDLFHLSHALRYVNTMTAVFFPYLVQNRMRNESLSDERFESKNSIFLNVLFTFENKILAC